MTQINKIGLIALLLIISIGSAQAESGSILIQDLTNKTYTSSSDVATYTPDWNIIRYDSSNLNYISNFHFNSSGNPVSFTFPKEFDSTYFTITSGGSGGGYAWYDKNFNTFYWVFEATDSFTSSPITLTYDTNIFLGVSTSDANFRASNTDVGIAKPVCVSAHSGATYKCMGLSIYADVVSGISATDTYSVSYPLAGKFSFALTKNPTVSTKYFILGSNSVYSQETTFNKNSFNSPLFQYNDGILLKVTLSSGVYNILVVNSTGIVTPPTPGDVTLTTDKANYQRGSPITITAINSGTSSVYLTGYGPTIMTDLLWNELVTAGQTKVINKVIQNDYPIGTYQINAATTMNYRPLVAVAYFNITLPTNTSNTLGLLWGDFLYSTGSTGTINAQGGFNASTLTITSPASIITTHSLISNQTASYSLTLNENGVWSARLVDNGNASNNIISNTTASPGNPSDNATFDTCKGQTTYICFNHPTYFRGDSFSLAYQSGFVILPVNLSITITAPSGKVTTLAKAPGTSGIVQGTIPLDAEIGTYWAKLVRPDDSVLNPGEVLAEGYTAVEAQLITPTPTNTPPTSTEIINTSNGLLMLFAQIAFYGLVIFVGIMFGLVKAGIQGSALLVMGGFIATFEALAGLFGGFGIYVIIITWIILAVYFRLGRDMTTGGE